MSVSTHGFRPRLASRTLANGVELLSSMRFSISLLTLICIASVIGTVLKQGEPFGNYVNQFGPFWAEFFDSFQLTRIYSAWWFLLILAFLVLSTSLCVARNTPKIIADWRNAKENIRVQSLRSFGQRAEGDLPDAPEAAAQRMGSALAAAGWKVKLQHRDAGLPSAGWMVAASAGAANKLGYIAAHSAIVLVCIGGLLDGDMMIRLQMLVGSKTAWNGGGMIGAVRPEHRLSPGNPTFRANLTVAEGTRSSTAILTQSNGILIQDLPFAVELKKFIVEYYSTGMPKLFASDIVIHDKETGESIPARVEVNHPARYKGVEIYQSSFDDGGSSVQLKALPLSPEIKPFEVEGVVGGSSELTRGQGQDKLTLEYTGLRVINVENMGDVGAAGTDVRKVNLRQAINARLGSANHTGAQKVLRNVGPSVGYKLRDAAGQAKEFSNYMLPIDMGDGQAVFLLGSRDSPAEPFRYLRIPADELGGMDGFARLKAALSDPARRERAVKRYVAQAVAPGRTELGAQLTASASRSLALFAGVQTPKGAGGSAADAPGGLAAVSNFIESNVPLAERPRASEVLIRILSGTLFELAQVSREDARLPLLVPSEKTQAWMTQAVLALSDSFYYPAPMAFMLKGFSQVQASVFQVARAPGKVIVYAGCALLILGIFAMLYIRERRLWIWLAPREGDAPEGSHAMMALSSNRKTMDADKEFEMLKSKLLPPPAN